jgi:multidrug resistance protein MdtO
MATRAAPVHPIPGSRSISWLWFRDFLRWEIAPYPGRTNTVARMTVTATLVMLIVVTFRIPNAFLAALYAILLARENLAATWNSGRVVFLGFVCASVYTLIGMMLFRGSPLTHFFWVVASLYLVFFVIRTATNYIAAATFAIPIGITLPLWDHPLPSQVQVEGTLWPVLIIAVGSAVTMATEAIYRIFDRSDPLIVSVDDLLLTTQLAAERIANYETLPQSTLDKICQYQMTGTGRLRVTLLRQGLDPTRRAQRSALISLAGRLIGLAADLAQTPHQFHEDDALRLRVLSERLASIRTTLRAADVVAGLPPALEGPTPSTLPMLQEMERVVELLVEVLQRNEIADGSLNRRGRAWWHGILVPDAFQNREYQRFAFAGCLAATICYVLYNVLDWPGIGQTCVITCIVTALTTVGNSLQAQFLRFAGFVAGGLLLGLSAQIFILPCIDTIFGFSVFFAAATAIAAWFATSSPRLSFFGVQMALSFYFINLQDSHLQTDLTIARDKIMGVLLGILAMGLIFDRFGTKSDAQQGRSLFVRTVRMLADLGDCPATCTETVAASEIRRLRSQINDNFASLESQMDAARFEFEFRRRREREAVECGRIQSLQPPLRSIYLLQLSLLSRRGTRESNSQLTEQQTQALNDFMKDYCRTLAAIASWVAQEEEQPPHINEDAFERLQRSFQDDTSPNSQAVVDICRKMASSLKMLRSDC